LGASDLFSFDRGQWWVLHTRPRAEKAVARFLGTVGVPFYLPLYARRWVKRGRFFSSLLPLFPGYLFIFGTDEHRLVALKTNKIVRVLQVPDQDRLRSDLEHTHRLIESGLPVTPEEKLAVGTRVEIVAGPLAGLTGIVTRRLKQLRFHVEVEFIQRGASVEIEGWMLQPMGKPSAVVSARAKPRLSIATKR